MSSGIDPGKGFALRDAAGRVPGIVTPDTLVEDLTAERDRLRGELARVQEERDQYLRALYAVTRQEVTISPEELTEWEQDGLSFAEVLAGVEDSLKEASDA